MRASVMPDTPKGCGELAAKAVANGWPALKMGWFPYASDPDEDRPWLRRYGKEPLTRD